MRAILFTLLALALCACVQREPVAHAECERSATHDVTFYDTHTPDTISVHAEGPSCKQAVVLFTLRNARGDALWTFANTYYDLTAGGTPPEHSPAVTPAQMDTFLDGFANASLVRTGTLPAWTEDKPSLAASVQGMSYNTELPRESYEMLRQRNLPLLCYAAAAEATQCLVMDPATASPTMMVAYGP